MKKKSSLNKTIDFSLEDGKKYLEKCVYYSQGKDLLNLEDSIICGDTFEIIKELEVNSFDLVIVDPPYNLYKNYHGKTFNKKKSELYRSYTQSWVELIYRLLKPNGSLYVCCDWQSSLIIGEVLQNKFILKNRITWQREKGRGANKNWKNSMEDIWFCTKSDNYTFNLDAVRIKKEVIAPYRQDGNPKDWVEDGDGKYRLTCPSNIWTDITVPFWSMAENTAHPTQKPEKLIAKLILASTNIGDKILDPFAGSGTTAVVAKKLGRHFIGVEQNELYCAWTLARLLRAENDTSIQGYENEEFLDRNFRIGK